MASLGVLGASLVAFLIVTAILGLVFVIVKILSGDIKQPSIFQGHYLNFNNIKEGIYDARNFWISAVDRKALYDVNAHEFQIRVKAGFSPLKRQYVKIRRDNCLVHPFNGGLVIIDGIQQAFGLQSNQLKQLNNENIRLMNENAKLIEKLSRVSAHKDQIREDVLKEVSGFNREYFGGVQKHSSYGKK